MNLLQRIIGRGLSLVLLVALGAGLVAAQTPATGTLRGRVMDEFGGVIVGATVTAIDPAGLDKSTTSDAEGNYVLAGLVPGKYTVRVATSGFASFENTEVVVNPGRSEPFDVTLGVSLEREEVTVASEAPISTEPENNADALVLREGDLDALPDDPDELAAALQALAGPSGGPNGGQIFIDGFSGGRMPSRDTIREVRINQNPFTAENDRPGFGGRIEILTKPGTDKLRGSGFFTFMDESFNSRNPFLQSDKRPPFQMRRFGGNLSGSIVPKRSSFFVDFERNEDDENDIINARVLDPTSPTLNEIPFNLAVQTPQRRISFSPRVDYQINAANTLVARYSFFRQRFDNSGLGSEFSLPSRAFDTKNSQHNLQLTETAVLGPTVINETRFQFIHGRSERDGDNSIPSVNVQGAFFGGGAQVGQSFSEDNRYELQNYTTWTLGTHSLKAGGRLRGVSITDVSRQNFGGTFVFTSLEQFRNTVRRQPGDEVTLLNVPSQFTLTTGEPEASVRQTDFGGFIQDDWKIRPNLTLSMGLRYELQSNIDSKFNFAPRFALAWSPGAGGQAGQPAKTVVRAGFGIFYDRVNENLTLQENRFNGAGQQQFIFDNRIPDYLNLISGVRFNADGSVSNLPDISSQGICQTPGDVTNPNCRRVTRRLDEEIQAPHTYFLGVNVERQIIKNVTAFASFGTIRSRNVLRLRNINAPLPGTFNFEDPAGSTPVRPFGSDLGDILQYESTGRSNLYQLAVGVNSRLSRSFTIFTNYVLSKALNDTDGGFGPFGGGGIGSPANPYDLSGEYARANFDSRHRFFFGGSFTLPKLNVSLNPFIQANSGRPFNITTGLDTNGDSLFTDRPAFATSATEPQFLRRTAYGDFDLNPQPGQPIIPRNFGEGPGFFSVNLRITKIFGFGNPPGADTRTAAAGSTGATSQAGAQGGGNRRGSAGGGGNRGGGPGGGGQAGAVRGGPGGGGPGGGGGGGSEKRYNLALSVQIFNLLNHTNLGQPVGNLSSRDFGNPISIAGGFGGGGTGSNAAGNRRIQAQLRFSF
ncbi:MAG TPA: TonB-dependent receptor [Pyrinomonadaceae bacterium]|nr:TonB-dependent receptor [Pyrinomonadaceae bacterium]